MQNTRKYILFVYLVLLIISSCSVKKNTPSTRAYHNLTARFNVLFNGRESYEKGMLKLQNSYEDDFSAMLPMFLFTKEDAAQSISPELDRAIKKATKLISDHSITAKPETKSSQTLSAKDLEFYNQKEFNKWVDEAYLLMGKSYFFKPDRDKSKETFQFVVSNFDKEPSAIEAYIWLARHSIEDGRYKEAESTLETLKKNQELPKKLQSDLYATEANYFIQQEEYKKSVVPLKKAIESTKDRYYRIRYTYVLAQVYQKNGSNSQASEEYRKVVKMNPPYTMAFNAKISRALNYQAGGGSSKSDIEKQLNKMLRDDKNIEYQDQIYYALGNMSLKDGDKAEAIEYYKKSMLVSTGNTNQLALSSLTLADLFYEMPDYILAQAYYDSTVAVIPDDYPNYSIIYAKSISLNKLVTHVKTVELQDSVQLLAKMPEPELLAYVDELIETEREAAEERRRLEEERQAIRMDQFAANDPTAGFGSDNSWYFYNTSSLKLGKDAFTKLWGNRKLEDNWRRKNKATAAFTGDSFADAEDGDADQTTVGVGSGTVVTNVYSREHYLQYIPFSDSMMSASHESIKIGLYEMGIIYSNELKDYPKAIDAFESLLSRYPTYDKKLQVYYKLYTIAQTTEDKALLSKYQQKIINEFPNSAYAQVLTNPDFLKQLQEKENEMGKLYGKTYQMFEQKRFVQAASNAQSAMEKYPDSEYQAQLDYIYTVSMGMSKDTLSFVNDLQNLVSRYPGSEIAENSTILVNYLQNQRPDVVEIRQERKAAELYKLSDNETHVFIITIPTGRNLNQLQFNIINFNLDDYSEEELSVQKVNLNSRTLACQVRVFENGKKAEEYLASIIGYEQLWKDVDFRENQMFTISESNLRTLLREKELEPYLVFYRNNYTKGTQ